MPAIFIVSRASFLHLCHLHHFHHPCLTPRRSTPGRASGTFLAHNVPVVCARSLWACSARRDAFLSNSGVDPQGRGRSHLPHTMCSIKRAGAPAGLRGFQGNTSSVSSPVAKPFSLYILLGHGAYAHCCLSAELTSVGIQKKKTLFFWKGVVRVVQTAPPPLAPPTGFGTYINSALKSSMVQPGWGATSNIGWESTRGCYALK